MYFIASNWFSWGIVTPFDSFRTVREHEGKLWLCLPGHSVDVCFSHMLPIGLPPSLPPFPLPSPSPLSWIKIQCAFCTCEAGGNVFPHVWVDVTQECSLRFSCTSCPLKRLSVKNAGVSWEARRLALRGRPYFCTDYHSSQRVSEGWKNTLLWF